MFIVFNQNTDEKSLSECCDLLAAAQLFVQKTEHNGSVCFLVRGSTEKFDIDRLRGLPYISRVVRLSEPYPLASKSHGAFSVDVKGCLFGKDFQLIAGPCAIESEERLFSVAEAVKSAGATLLRGGAYKPRTSPYAFQGMGKEGLRLLALAGKHFDLPVVSEIMSETRLDEFFDIDVIQVGARSMQNYSLLKELSKLNKPILLKRGQANTIEEWLMSAEYLLNGGNDKVILCERGIRTFEPSVRSALDLTSIALAKELSHLPVIVDPSHAAGLATLVPPLALAAVCAGADGLMLEVHNEPSCALCDGMQSLLPKDFSSLTEKIRAILPIIK